jgi:hypothetical protein
MIMRKAFALAVLFCLTTAASAGALYRWVDKDGNVHYGDQAPPGIQAQLVKPDVSHAPSEPSDEEAAAAKARSENCKKLQAQLDSYTKSSKITETDALGNTHDYSDDEKKKLLEQTKAKVDDACSGITTAAATP